MKFKVFTLLPLLAMLLGVTSSPPSKGGASRDLTPRGREEPFTRRLSPSPATG